jgi:hypothetical protein
MLLALSLPPPKMSSMRERAWVDARCALTMDRPRRDGGVGGGGGVGVGVVGAAKRRRARRRRRSG